MMVDSNHYETLNVSPEATQAEIKQAYRRLVKQYHPDVNQKASDQEQMIRINAAYEVLGDTRNRSHYDRQIHRQFSKVNDRQQRTVAVQKHQVRRKTGRDVDEQVEEWLRLVYQPINCVVYDILNSLEQQIEKLAADPFDDQLLEEFQTYLETCRNDLKQAQINFRSLPNPRSLARTAAHLYYCLNQIGDGLDELEYFPLNYDESYLHAGQEMFRIANHLHWEAQDSLTSEQGIGNWQQ